MVKLRLKRMGSKFNAFYRIVAADARAPRDGRFIEEVGYYNPHSKETFVNLELRSKWEKEGAVASTTVKNLFKKYDKASKKGSENGIVTLEIKPKKVKTAEVKMEKVASEQSAIERSDVVEVSETDKVDVGEVEESTKTTDIPEEETSEEK